MPDESKCTMWGVWCTNERGFVGETFLHKWDAETAAARHGEQWDHKTSAQCIGYWNEADAPASSDPPADVASDSSSESTE